eukprot:CAMPEP_0175306574 /NCGR_PEP_ID=MMETSP0093-20121207/64316_1 /TAXON_ID=311494 /ORGANISM="Alexandrium monilatum, Strain CCMP3105" /LENGTH=53 /DNA_ID=CAMNT_0016603009 /DNA_START=39 /DNA_END=197 /DNA_ORIENTATION=+
MTLAASRRTPAACLPPGRRPARGVQDTEPQRGMHATTPLQHVQFGRLRTAPKW